MQFGRIPYKRARHLAENLDDDRQAGRQEDLAHIAQIFQCRHDRVTLEIAVEDFYRSYENGTSEILQQRANLPFTICINTTHDHFLANAFEAVGKKPIRDFYWFRKHKFGEPVAITQEQRLVYSLFGCITEEVLAPWILHLKKEFPSVKNISGDDPSGSLPILGIGAALVDLSSPEEVADRVRRYIDIGGKGGRFFAI